MLNKYKVTLVVKIIEVDVEANSLEEAKTYMEYDIKSRVHKGNSVETISYEAELIN